MKEKKQERFVALHTKHQRSVFNYLLGAVHDYQTAQDLLQNVSLTLWKKFDSYDERRPFVGWAFGMARIELARHFRARAKGEQLLPLEILDAVSPYLEEKDPDLSVEMNALMGCVEKLPEKEKTMLELRYKNGCSLRELAECIGKTVGAANVALSRIRSALLGCTKRALLKDV